MKSTNETSKENKKLFPIFSSVFELPAFIDYLIDKGWMIEYIAVDKRDDYGRGIMHYYSVNGNIRLFIEKHVLSIKKVKLILFFAGQVYNMIISPDGIITNLSEEIVNNLINDFKEKAEEYKIKKVRESDFFF